MSQQSQQASTKQLADLSEESLSCIGGKPSGATALEKSPPRFYALERLRKLREQIPRLSQELVVNRARVEKVQDETASEVTRALEKTRSELISSLSDAQFCLLEMEEKDLSTVAEQLQECLARFELMSTRYRPVYEVLIAFSNQLPVGQTANAAIIGRLMNHVRMGYYPTDPDNITHIKRAIRFPQGVTANLLDPCCGCGRALEQIAQGENCVTYGIELDESRAGEAGRRLARVGTGSFFSSRISRETFHFLFLNPPYLSVLNESGGRARHEKKFLIESIPLLVYGGLMAYVIPYYRLTPDICCILCDSFEDLTVWRFSGKEFDRFKQVVIFGIRKKRGEFTTDARWLERHAISPGSIPCITQIPEWRYALPACSLDVRLFKGEKFNEKELEEYLRRSSSVLDLIARSELDLGAKQPPLPLSISQVGLVGGSGMINGLIDCAHPHIVKGRIIKVVREERSEHYNPAGRHTGAEIRETVSNKMIFNILTPNGFKSLT